MYLYRTLRWSRAESAEGSKKARTMMIRPFTKRVGWRLAGAATALLFLATVTQAQTDGLVAWWNFDDNNFADSIGIYDGEEQGTLPIQFVAGKTGFGNAISMDGEDQEILIVGGEPDDLAFAGSTMSVAGWFRVTAFDTSWQALIAKGEGTKLARAPERCHRQPDLLTGSWRTRPRRSLDQRW
jgi:hypothetical protein